MITIDNCCAFLFLSSDPNRHGVALLHSLLERSARVLHLGLFVCMSVKTRDPKKNYCFN